MRRTFRSKPSASMVVAFMALLLALGGTAVALPGNNTVTSGDIKRGAVGTSDIKNNSVRTQDIRNSTVRGKDVRNNTLTGADIRESTLGTVPRANFANSAGSANTANSANTATTATRAGSVDGQDFQKLLYAGDCDVGEVTLFSGGGLVVTYDSDDDDIEVTTTVANSVFQVFGSDHGTFFADVVDDFDPGSEESFLPNDDDNSGTGFYVNPNGSVITINLAANDESDLTDCVVWGTATIS